MVLRITVNSLCERLMGVRLRVMRVKKRSPGSAGPLIYDK